MSNEQPICPQCSTSLQAVGFHGPIIPGKRLIEHSPDELFVVFECTKCSYKLDSDISKAQWLAPEPSCPEHCGHDPKFYYVNPDPRAIASGEVEPMCWHEDEDGICGHVCPAPAVEAAPPESIEPPERVNTGTPPDRIWVHPWHEVLFYAPEANPDYIEYVRARPAESSPPVEGQTEPPADEWVACAQRIADNFETGCDCQAIFCEHVINRVAAITRESHGSRVAELERALQPFVAVGKGYRDSQTDDLILLRAFDSRGKHYDLTLGDLRAARSVLEAHGSACAAKGEGN